MTCYYPLKGYKDRNGGFTSSKNKSWRGEPMTVPCGQCVGCRLAYSRAWAVRCINEAQMHDHNSFITLTYNDDNLPYDGGLRLRDFQLFMKKLRKETGIKIRFFHCGEYGDQTQRPHYHAIIFGYDFPDKYYWRNSNTGHRLYRSQLLEKLWPMGHSEIGDVTFESAAYVARYILKKMNGDLKASAYERVCPDTGEIFQVQPEYTTMSRRPGIGSTFFDKFQSDIYPHDFIVIDGKKLRPPKFYDNQYELVDPEGHKALKERRKVAQEKHLDNQTPERLNVRERVQRARISKLKRGL